MFGLLRIVIFFALWPRQTNALGTAGAMERCYYWAAYMLEDSAAATRPITPTIAPGCADFFSLNPGTRCDLNQFLQYIWAPNPNGHPPHQPPPVNVPAFRDDPPRADRCWNDIRNAYDVHGGVGYVDNHRLYPGSTDFYDALGRVGRSVSVALTSYHLPLRNRFENMAALARDSISRVQAYRFKKFEGYRLADLRRAGTLNIGTRRIDLTWMGQGNFDALDIDATVHINRGLDRNRVIDILTDMNDHILANDQAGRDHWAAVLGARNGMSNCACGFARFPPFKVKRAQLGNQTVEVELQHSL